MKILEAALKYQEKGYSVIPVGQDKVSLIKWEPYQNKKASKEEIQVWFEKFPLANVGVVTGAISNLLVVDCDTPEAILRIQESIPDSLLVPCEITPREGMHFFFAHSEGYSNRARVAEGTDLRTSGGYCVIAPSINGTGKGWEWVVSLLDADPPDITNSITSLFSSFSLYARGGGLKEGEKPDFFSNGRRDEDLIHAALLLQKGGSEKDFTRYILKTLVNSWGENDPKWVEAKIKSAWERGSKRERKVSEEVLEYVMTTTGNFLTTECHKNLDLTTKDHKKNVTMILKRLCDKGIIERYGNKNGSWRRIDRTIQEQCWWESEGLPLPIRFPLEVDKYAKIFSGNVILLEGQKSQGKSAFALEFCRLNKRLFKDKILYQNIEMSGDELTDRFISYGDVMTPEEWRESVTIIRQSGDWWDKINPDGLNVVDYLIEYKESYLIADFIWKIHQRLNKGIALIVVQRDPLKPYPTGGRGVRDIPRLIISLIHHKIRLEDVKSFYITSEGNPTGMVRKYKQVSWWRFIPVTEWEHQEDEKYSLFKKE